MMNVRAHLSRCVPIALACLLAACASMKDFNDARKRVAPGGQLERDTRDAKAQEEVARAEQDRLRILKEEQDAELRRNAERIAAVESAASEQGRLLAQALNNKQVSASRHAELKSQLDAIRAETLALQRQNKADEAKAAIDPKVRADKDRRLRDLEQRRKDLERVLAQLVGGR